MTREEKAKAYDEALEKARRIKNGEGDWRYSDLIEIGPALTEIFPELAESEDERMMEDLIGGLMWQRDNLDTIGPYDNSRILPGFCLTVGEHLAYLEKQKERGRNITANLLEDGITGVQRELIEFLANNIDASWVDVIKSADAYAQRIRSMVEKREEQKPLSTEETELNSIAFLEQMGYTCIPPGKEQKPVEYLDKDKVYAIMNKLTNLSYSQLIPINSDEFKKLHEITSDVRDLLDYPIEQKPISSCDIVPYIDDKIAALQDMWREEKVAFDWDDMHEMIEDVARHFYQKEQKPVDLSEMMVHKEPYIAPVPTPMVADEQKPAEWSEEDDWKRKELIQYLEKKGDYRTVWMTWLKSLRPQPIQLKEAYKDGFQTARHATALTFMNYLDENRPEGKMGLSNAECEDIDKAFKENDWAKIIRYIEKYSPSWKPSEQEKGALRTAIHILTDERSFPKAAAHLQNILNAFEGKESRKDWKPSEEQIQALEYAVSSIPPNYLKEQEYMMTLIGQVIQQLKKLM